jgi:sigma-B regulation protein RsbU (phosphoserine phosphatase)
MARRTLVLAITAFQVIGFGSLIGWRVAEWSGAGWAGMAYQLDPGAETDAPRASFFWNTESGRVEVLAPGGPAARAGISERDTVVAVNGIAIGELDRLQGLADTARTGDSIRYSLVNGDARREVELPLENPYRHPVTITATATSVIAGAVFVLISMLVYWSRPRSRVALVFFLMCLFGAAEYLTLATIELDLPSLRGVTPAVVEAFMFVGLALVGLFSVALVNTLLHLSLIFPRARPVVERWPQVVVWLHTFPFLGSLVAAAVVGVALLGKEPIGLVASAAVLAALGSVAVIRLSRALRSEVPRRVLATRPLLVQALVVLAGGALGMSVRLLPEKVKAVVLVVVFAAGFVTGIAAIVCYSVCIIVSLLRSYRESGTDEKRQLRWPLWGTLTAVGGSIVLTIVSLILGFAFGEIGHFDYTSNVVLTALTKMVYLLIPVSLAFGIVKYRLMEIDLIIRKTVVYSLVTGFVLVVYLVLAGVSGLALVRSAGLESQTATVVATLVVVALFVPVRVRVQRFVDRVFFKRERDTQASIGRITESVMQATSIETLALAVAEEVQRALGVRSVAMLVRRAGSDTVAAAATVGLPDGAAAALHLGSDSPIFASSSLHLVADRDPLAADERRLLERAVADRAILCRRGDETVGMITVGRKLSREPFDDEDEVFLEAVAGQLTIGLGRLRGRRAELEFNQALQIQRSLLPAEVPQIGGFTVTARWQPAREVSGDYYDVLRLGEGHLALCIGDVVGKGMPAALLMSSLQAATKAVAAVDASPDVVCRQVRSVVTSNLTGGRFVTFFYAVVDAASSMLRYTNCGQNQPVLVRGDGTVLRLDRGGPAFARLMRDLPYDAGEAPLEPGDRLVLFTDGVSEAADAGGEQFGEDRLVELVARNRAAAAGELEAIITRAVLDHAGGELQDDLTLVVVAVG